MVTSAMFVLAKPMPAIVAKTKVASQTIHPASAVARWRACHARAATEGMTSAAMSEAVTRRIKADFTRILLDIAYNDRSSVTAHRSPQALAGGDHPPARQSPWLVEVCHKPGR